MKMMNPYHAANAKILIDGAPVCFATLLEVAERRRAEKIFSFGESAPRGSVPQEQTYEIRLEKLYSQCLKPEALKDFTMTVQTDGETKKYRRCNFAKIVDTVKSGEDVFIQLLTIVSPELEASYGN